MGRLGELRELLEQWVMIIPRKGFSVEEVYNNYSYGTILESAVLAGHTQAVELLRRIYSDGKLKIAGIFSPFCTIRYLGEASALLKEYDEARKYYQEAIKVCAEMRFRPELALSCLSLAEHLLEHYPAEKKEALEHLDFAIKEFREMKMQPSLERALRHKDILKA